MACIDSTVSSRSLFGTAAIGGCGWCGDPFGVEPLFYALVNRRLSFASEISALWQNPDVSRDVDIEGFDAFMTFIYVPASERKYSFSQVLNRFVYGANQGKWRDHAS